LLIYHLLVVGERGLGGSRLYGRFTMNISEELEMYHLDIKTELKIFYAFMYYEHWINNL
jgi:hypothetical protein